MSQFDSLIILPLIYSLTIILFSYYNLSIKILIPNFFGTKKFRTKKIGLSVFYNFFNENSKIKADNSRKVIL
jgi:hypothetical protein